MYLVSPLACWSTPYPLRSVTLTIVSESHRDAIPESSRGTRCPPSHSHPSACRRVLPLRPPRGRSILHRCANLRQDHRSQTRIQLYVPTEQQSLRHRERPFVHFLQTRSESFHRRH